VPSLDRETGTGAVTPSGNARLFTGGTGTDTRPALSALWTSLLFVFAYTDLFSLYRPDVRADIARGQLAGFDIGPGFLLGATLYILPAALMVCLSLLLPSRIARTVHLCLAPVYVVTIIVSALGEWSYYLLASGVEVMLLVLIFCLARGGEKLALPPWPMRGR